MYEATIYLYCCLILFSILMNQFCLSAIGKIGVFCVIDSDHPDFLPDDLVTGITKWEQYSLINKTEGWRKILSTDVPISYRVGLLGI